MSEAAIAQQIDENADAQSSEVTDQEPKVEPTPEPEKAIPPSIGRFGLQVERVQKWRLDVPITVSPEQCMDEGFWTHLAAHLRPGDEVRVLPDDMRWELVLHVVNAGKDFVQVVKKAFYELVPKQQRIALPPKYTFDYAGTTHKHRVLREGKMLKDGFATEALAHRWAANHEAAVNR